ncbi:AmiS/UreI family transporter [Halopolyspora algeriensis]|uniref:AmiS/UreI family transporter n=1 Tax=Halopolyspora algeriensis TaxID=1500506 RepID=UPI00211E4479|nr:AmiS/UreI family transporter [Halopolyspora algeriensis]
MASLYGFTGRRRHPALRHSERLRVIADGGWGTMLLGIVLLYVGAVLGINGIWLVGQARAARAAASASTSAEPQAGPRLGQEAKRLEREEERVSGPEHGAAEEKRSSYIQNREISVINFFTGGLGAIIAIISFTLGAVYDDDVSIATGGFVFLFAFTYLWLALNQFLEAGGHAFGWYCLFVAITAVPTGVFTLVNAEGHAGSIWLGIDWFAWAVLWFMFFMLLALEHPIGRLTGYVTTIIGIGTAWALGYALLQGQVSLAG